MQKQPYLLVSAIDQLLISPAGFGSFCPLFTYIWCSSKRVRTLVNLTKQRAEIELYKKKKASFVLKIDLLPNWWKTSQQRICAAKLSRNQGIDKIQSRARNSNRKTKLKRACRLTHVPINAKNLVVEFIWKGNMVLKVNLLLSEKKLINCK